MAQRREYASGTLPGIVPAHPRHGPATVSRGRHPSTSNAERGYTLIEVLVAVVILSIGLLGLALLTGMGLQDNTRAYQRSIAVFLAYDIADRMRANPEGMIKGYYVWDLDPDTDPPATEPACNADGTCDPRQRASRDVYHWSNALRLGSVQWPNQGLPQGSGSILQDDTNPSRYHVNVRWVEAENRSGGNNPGGGTRCTNETGETGFSCVYLAVQP